MSAEWTFPLNFAEIISGDGKEVFRERIKLNDTRAFGKKKFTFNASLKGRKWVRAELRDIAAKGAFTTGMAGVMNSKCANMKELITNSLSL